MHKKSLYLMWFISMSLILPSFLGAQMGVDLGTIKKSLVCTCECNMTVDACEGSMSCKAAENLTVEAKELIKKGVNKAGILSVFVKRYGEQILSAPSKKGFNLIAWILPFTVFIFIGFGIVIMLRNWTRHTYKSSAIYKDDNPANTDQKYEEQLNKALGNLD